MKELNAQATRIFASLLDSMYYQTRKVFSAGGITQLDFRKLAQTKPTPFGTGICFGLCQANTPEDAPLKDPHMHFIVSDRRRRSGHFQALHIYPYLLIEHATGRRELSVVAFRHSFVVLVAQSQEEHASLANEWLIRIQAEGFLI